MLLQYLICSYHKGIDRVNRHKHHSSPDSHLPNDQYNRQCNQSQEKEPNIPHEAPPINLHILLRDAQRHCPNHNTSHKYSATQHAVKPHITGTTPHKRCNARKHVRSTITKGEQSHTSHRWREPQQHRHLLEAAAEVVGGRVAQHVEQRRQAHPEHSVAQHPEPLASAVEEV
uniref:Cation:cation antiporter, putative n=1 Tax=Arundo donax TaxID=35708 RepID=A0A0A9E8D7_ARUDO